MSFKTPILINAFNRPLCTKKVFDVVREIKPDRLFIAIDGPRDYKVGEGKKCAEVKSIFIDIDWKCDVKTLYREKNIGCPKAIPEAIDWFFSYVEEGIILEDDCVPDKSFFNFCEELLNKYRNESKVIMVGGTNFFPKERFSTDSYFFSRYSFIWGWATWRRAWGKFDAKMKSYPEFKKPKNMRKAFPNILERFFWKTSFDNKYYDYNDGWGVKWVYTLISNNGLGIIPRENLITNIGFGPDATMTVNVNEKLIVPSNGISFPLKHPKNIKESEKYSRKVFRRVFLSTVNPIAIFKNYVRALRIYLKRWIKN